MKAPKKTIAERRHEERVAMIKIIAGFFTFWAVTVAGYFIYHLLR
jgi:hypothetical protein